MKPKKVGRPGGPSTLTDQQRNAFYGTLRLPGATIGLCARCAGVCERTLYLWLSKGRELSRLKRPPATNEYLQFFQDVQRIKAEAERSALALVIAAARRAKNPDWKAAWAILQARYSKRYGTRDTHIVRGDANAPVIFVPDVGGPPASPPEAIRARLAARADHLTNEDDSDR